MLIAGVLIRPADHAWHHGAAMEEGAVVNFGATWALWDRLHGTWRTAETPPEALGIAAPLSLTRKLLWPFA